MLLNTPCPAAHQAAGTKWDTSLEEQLCYEIKTFLLAGHETSAAMLTWSTYELSQSSEARQRVVKEATEVRGWPGWAAGLCTGSVLCAGAAG